MPYTREQYNKRKKEKICVHCGKRHTDGKHVRCDICRQKDREYSQRIKDKNILYQKQYRNGLKIYGLCIRCGKEKALAGLSQCRSCSERSNKRKHVYSKEEYEKHCRTLKERYYERKKDGICVICGKNKSLPNRVKCGECTIKLNQERSGYIEHSELWYSKERKEGRL